MGAPKNVLPDILLHGCYFHYVNSIQKRADKLGINKYPNTKRLVLLTARLPLLPSNLINEGWMFVKSFLNDDENNMTAFVKYFERTWLKDENFVAVWISFGLSHRTTNSLETW
jgi:hypothetical protein